MGFGMADVTAVGDCVTLVVSSVVVAEGMTGITVVNTGIDVI